MGDSVYSESLPSLRINVCEVCSKKEAKYTCPRCEVRTCCLECLKIHKKELDCNGLREKVKFKMLKDFDNIDFLNDYRLLEETARLISRSDKLPAKSCYSERYGTLPRDLYQLKRSASVQGIQLYFLPPSFSRHLNNSSFFDQDTQNLYWHIDWVFPQAENITLSDERVLDSSVLSACLHKYIQPEEDTHPSLSFYKAAGHTGIKLLLKAERVASNRYYILDSTATIRENLRGKSIIEYPVIHVVLSDHIYMYNIFSEEEEETLRKRNRRRHFAQKKRTSNNNFIFSNPNIGEDHESNGEDASSNLEEIYGYDRSNKQHNNESQHRRKRRNHFRNTWNLKSRGGMQQHKYFYQRNNNNCNEHVINGGLSNRFSSVNIHQQ